MSVNVDRVIEASRLAIATVDGLMVVIDKARSGLAASAAQLKEVLAEAEAEKKKGHDQLAADRKEADDDLDRKFDPDVT